MYAKVSINPESDMQNLKVHKDLFKKGYGTKGDLLLLLIDFGVSSNSTACSHGNWGWRRCLELARVRQ